MSSGRMLLLYPVIGVATSFGVAIRDITRRNHLTNRPPTRAEMRDRADRILAPAVGIGIIWPIVLPVATIGYLSLKISEQLVDRWPEKLEE